MGLPSALRGEGTLGDLPAFLALSPWGEAVPASKLAVNTSQGSCARGGLGTLGRRVDQARLAFLILLPQPEMAEAPLS